MRRFSILTSVVLLVWLARMFTPTFAEEVTNLARNPGFEDGETMPTHWKSRNISQATSFRRDANVKHKGSASLRVVKKGNKYWPIDDAHQEVEGITAGGKLAVSVYVKADQTRKSVVDVRFFDANGKWLDHKWLGDAKGIIKGTHDWKEYKDTLDAPACTAKARICLQMYGSGTVWFDDVVLQYHE